MNTPSPLVPQGSLHHSREKSTVRTAFFTIAAIHLVFFGGLLIQGGCKKSEDKPATEGTNDYSLPPITNDPLYSDTNVAPPDTNLASPVPPFQPDIVQPPVMTETKEYVVVKGDSFSTIAQKTGSTVAAITQANPGVDSTKLQIGQKLQIPPAPANGGLRAAPTTSSGDSTIYVVKSGDMLEKIARSKGTTVKAIMELNNLKTTTIKPGQKLKLPSNSSTAPATSPGYVTPLPSTNP